MFRKADRESVAAIKTLVIGTADLATRTMALNRRLIDERLSTIEAHLENHAAFKNDAIRFRQLVLERFDRTDEELRQLTAAVSLFAHGNHKRMDLIVDLLGAALEKKNPAALKRQKKGKR